MLAFILIFGVLAFWFYKHYSDEQKYWERKGIPGPPSAFLFGNLRELWFDGKARSIVMKEWTKQYGKIYGCFEGQRKILVVSDLDFINEILIKQHDHFNARVRFVVQRDEDGPKSHIFEAQGAHWKRLRQIASCAFTNRALKQIKLTVENSAITMAEGMEREMKSGTGSIDVLKYYQECTMDIISKIALGQKDVQMFNNPYLQTCKDVFSGPMDVYVNILPAVFKSLSEPMYNLMIFVGKFIGIEFFNLVEDIEKAVVKRKKEREGGSKTSTDFIDMFLDAEVETDDVKFGSEVLGKVVVQDEIVNLCMLIILAGFETTSNALGYLSYFLANRPDIQEKMREEIDAVVPDDSVEWDALPKLKYTEATIKEALRHYPLASVVVSRTCMKDTEVCGYKIKKGDMIQTDTWSLHMDKEIWGEDAEEFRPERWLEASDRARIAFQSFGEGPMMCLGMRLAYIEEKIAIAHVLKRFVIEKNEQTNPIKIKGAFTAIPEQVVVTLRPRK